MKRVKRDLKKLSSPEKSKKAKRYFKTGKGQYGEGDVFLGINAHDLRSVINKYELPLNSIKELLKSKIHEHRLAGLLILVKKYGKASEKEKKEIFNFYIKNAEKINNWDLVDCSASYIAGDYLLNKDKKILYNLANSKNLWKKRISIISTHTFIKNNEFKDTLKISKILLKDNHDLIHKAVGWMLREVGKKDMKKLEGFLQKHYKDIPRTTLRYSIEKFPERKQKKYLKGRF